MPRGDGTGPMGMSSMTGRARGFCAGFNTPGYSSAPAVRGFGRFCNRDFSGRSRGYRNMFYATGIPGRMSVYNSQSRENEAANLKILEGTISRQLEEIRKRLGELEK